MNLHRANSKADWANINPDNHNFWQRYAAATNGVVTPGNFFTVIGAAIVLIGLILLIRHHYYFGLIALIFGRGLDIVDGIAAESTGTKSPLGEKLDAGFDKLGTLATLIVFGLTNIAPWWILVAVFLPHVVITAIAVSAYYRGKVLHPSRIGKLSMAAAWLGLIGFVLIAALRASPSPVLIFIVYLITVTSIIMGACSALGYLKK